MLSESMIAALTDCHFNWIHFFTAFPTILYPIELLHRQHHLNTIMDGSPTRRLIEIKEEYIGRFSGHPLKFD
jgi:hypothetical protein